MLQNACASSGFTFLFLLKGFSPFGFSGFSSRLDQSCVLASACSRIFGICFLGGVIARVVIDQLPTESVSFCGKIVRGLELEN